MSSAGLLFLTAVFVFTIAPLVQPGSVVYNQIDWSKSGGGAKKFVIGSYVKLNWQNARAYCNNHCMELASIRSVEEQDEVVALIRRSEGFANEPSYWIGGTNSANKDKWVWSGSSDPIDFVYWRDYAPSRGANENCLRLFDGYTTKYGWKDTWCNDGPFLFICEHNTTYPHDYV